MHYSPLVLFHFGGGICGLLSGAVAMIFRKGSRGHRFVGTTFSVSMLGLTLTGMTLALLKDRPPIFSVAALRSIWSQRHGLPPSVEKAKRASSNGSLFWRHWASVLFS
jgi:uncharacterized membrane protein